ncbi:heme-dependent oxidative N-demethylase family protein [Paracoccus aminophilus]|uniref:DUF3445 domain-containing protein n=1 Tax=Paracoccus aminophilus JCM 7686 TaxID=1367847 RepID=S5Y8Z8_PARAH|nr:DUF3445 domain-containing protein [Paracoccus aminophilus]AGT07823.1 hypothetical protein JCM7686_0714 [Paracoccus aminophilus JCM 7686]
MGVILQKRLAFAPWEDARTRRLPGVIPVAPEDWLVEDDAFAEKMALRAELIATQEAAVHRMAPDALAAARELYGQILALLPGRGYQLGPDGVIRRPDGVEVLPDLEQPLLTLGRLVVEDFCLMLPDGESGHALRGAILCFPAGWTLAEKFGRAMLGIHQPVAKYDEALAPRVQRLMDGMRTGIGLLRGTAHHSNAPLHNPRSEAQGHSVSGDLPFIRVERQCLFRLPETGAVVFSIHTTLIREADLSEVQKATLAEFPIRDAA